VVVIESQLDPALAALIARLEEYASDESFVMHVYEEGRVPPSPPSSYAVVYAAHRPDSTARRAADVTTSTAYRFVVQFVAALPSDGRWLRSKVFAALVDYTLNLDDYDFSKLHFEPGAVFERDNILESFYTASDMWTCNATPINQEA